MDDCRDRDLVPADAVDDTVAIDRPFRIASDPNSGVMCPALGNFSILRAMPMILSATISAYRSESFRM